MFSDVEAIYLSFLDGIRMAKQSVVKRDKFSRIWNEWALNQWVKDNLSFGEGFEFSDKQIDDLQTLIVSTDGVFIYEGNVLYPIAPVSGSTNVFPIPRVITTLMNSEDRSAIYPLYKSTKKVWVDNGTDWVEASPLKAISEGFTKGSYYTGPSADRVYYKIMNDHVYIDNGDSFTAVSIKYEYIRYPNVMVCDTSSTPYTLTYTLDLGQDQLEEIRDKAIKLYLERQKDERYKSFYQEDMSKQISKI